MVATVGSISIDLSTNSVKFAEGFKKSASTVEQQSNRMAKAVGGIDRAFASVNTGFKAFAGGLVGGFLGGGAIDLFTRTIGKAREAIAEFDDIATKARTTGLGTDTFQAMAFAAQKANIEQEALNSSLEIFAKNAGLAEQGTGALFSGLQKLNPELLRNIINTKDQEERLKLVADALHRTKNAAEEAALSTVIFGRGGAGMSRLFEEGAQSIDRMVQNARELGILIPPDLLARGEKLDDMLDTLSTVIGVNFKQALVNVAGPIGDFATGMVGMTAALNKFAQSPSLSTFMDFLNVQVSITPGSAADVFLSLFTKTSDQAAQDLYDVQVQMAAVGEEIRKAEADAAKWQKRLEDGFPVPTEMIEKSKQDLDALHGKMDALAARAADIKMTIDTSQADAAITRIRQRTDALAAQFRAMDAAAATAGKPAVLGVTVTRHDLSAPTAAGEAVFDEDGNVTINKGGVVPKQISVKDYLAGKRASGGPVQISGSYLTGERGPELFTPGAAGNVSSASQTAGILSGAAAWIEQIEMHTYDSVDLLRSMMGYLQTIESDQEAALAALGGIQAAIEDMEASATKYSAVGGTAGGVGGISAETGGGYIGGGWSSGRAAGRENYLYTPNPRSYNAVDPSRGFASGGAIQAGDTQHVEFYKNPSETVEVLRPGQRSRYGGTSVGDINIYVTGDIGSRQSQLAMRDELHRAVSAAMNRP